MIVGIEQLSTLVSSQSKQSKSKLKAKAEHPVSPAGVLEMS